MVGKLARLGITRIFDLVLHLPLRYDDETRLYPINEAPSGLDVLVEGREGNGRIRATHRAQDSGLELTRMRQVAPRSVAR